MNPKLYGNPCFLRWCFRRTTEALILEVRPELGRPIEVRLNDRETFYPRASNYRWMARRSMGIATSKFGAKRWRARDRLEKLIANEFYRKMPHVSA